MSVFVMVCETRPLPVYPIVFRHPGLPVAGKHIVFNLIHCHVRSFLLVSLIWHPACQVWGGGAGEKNRLQYFEFGLQYLVQPLGVNPTYSTFKKKLSCWYQEMPFLLVRIAMVMSSWILMRSSLFLVSTSQRWRKNMHRNSSFLFICFVNETWKLYYGWIHLFIFVN